MSQPSKEDKVLEHLEAIRKDIRGELMRRMGQRDTYSIQLTIALGAIVAVSVSPTGFGKALVAAPLVSLYFTVLIQYSYRVHKIAAHYLRDKIEPEFAKRLGTPRNLEWEVYYNDHAEMIPGVRSTFFLWALWAVTVLSGVYLYAFEPAFRTVLYIMYPLYLLANIWVTWPNLFKRKKPNVNPPSQETAL